MAFQYSVSLQVWHPYADPEIIQCGLGLKASMRHRSGDDRPTPSGTALPGRYKETYCLFELCEGADGKLADCLKSIVGELQGAADYVADIRATGGRLNFYVGWVCGDRGEVLDSELLSGLGALGIDLGIEPFRVEQRR